MADINKLITELTDNPSTYEALSDTEVADLGNTVEQTRPRTSITSTEVFNAIVVADFLSLADGERRTVMSIMGFGEINPFGREADVFISIFGASSGTITALATLRQEAVSLFEKLGIGFVIPRNVADARRNML